MNIIKIGFLSIFLMITACSKTDFEKGGGNFVNSKADNFMEINNPERGVFQKDLPDNYGFNNYNRIDTEKGFAVEFSYRIGADKHDKNKVFRNPLSFELDSKGNIYIVDNENNRIQKFSRGGKFLLTIGGEKGNAEGQFNFPTDVAFDSEDNVYITDHENKRIQVFDEDGNFLKILEFGGEKPAFIAIDSEDNLYIHHMSNSTSIWKYDKEGNFLLSFGKAPFNSKDIVAADIKSYTQAQVALDKNDNVYVVYRSRFIIDKFDKNGIHLMRINKEPRKWIKEREKDLRNHNLDTGQKKWNIFVYDISISPEGFMWVANTEGMDIYDSNGKFLYFLRMTGKGGSEFVPHAIHVKNEKEIMFLNSTAGTLTIFFIVKKNVD